MQMKCGVVTYIYLFLKQTLSDDNDINYLCNCLYVLYYARNLMRNNWICISAQY